MFRETFSANLPANCGDNEVILTDNKRTVLLSILILLFSFCLSAQSYKIDYYGIVSNEIDANMSKMTSDLYFTQLSEINNFSVQDKRTTPCLSERPDIEELSDSSLSFFTIITKDSKTDKWITTYYVVDKIKDEEHSKRKTYDSFYKILMESKDVLKDTIKQLIENDTAKTASAAANASKDIPVTGKATISSTEELSGTWGGEENINKIVIMRGGRGFVIFNNGASMNITVEFLNTETDKKIIVTQKGGSNASYYPELKRTAALSAAVSADPIKWTLNLVDNNTLKGIKDTLLPDGDSYIKGNMNVVWTRIN